MTDLQNVTSIQTSNVSETLPLHEYNSLQPGQIRLVRLVHQAPHTPEIECDVTTHVLAKCPKYTAVSYCWGKPVAPSGHSLVVAGQLIPVQENLFGFLTEYLRRSQSRTDGPAPPVADNRRVFDSRSGKRLAAIGSHTGTHPDVDTDEDQKGERFLWIDAICINQSDAIEKNM